MVGVFNTTVPKSVSSAVAGVISPDTIATEFPFRFIVAMPPKRVETVDEAPKLDTRVVQVIASVDVRRVAPAPPATKTFLVDKPLCATVFTVDVPKVEVKPPEK